MVDQLQRWMFGGVCGWILGDRISGFLPGSSRMRVNGSSPAASLSSLAKNSANLAFWDLPALSPSENGFTAFRLSFAFRRMPSIVVNTLPNVPASSVSSIYAPGTRQGGKKTVKIHTQRQRRSDQMTFELGSEAPSANFAAGSLKKKKKGGDKVAPGSLPLVYREYTYPT